MPGGAATVKIYVLSGLGSIYTCINLSVCGFPRVLLAAHSSLSVPSIETLSPGSQSFTASSREGYRKQRRSLGPLISENLFLKIESLVLSSRSLLITPSASSSSAPPPP
ncbi:hypothetical protein PNOK_0610000 [Pyrrhoderma noxium]|uniref:Uncharacterized protein n=1 Tax=Pyrrhoderma noxium TaxID=2282107 RepID=A0A286UDK9_9AGAM|nr:hypothetical protein PNOK_0610000 [Pyrrhoderma noxium]